MPPTPDAPLTPEAARGLARDPEALADQLASAGTDDASRLLEQANAARAARSEVKTLRKSIRSLEIAERSAVSQRIKALEKTAKAAEREVVDALTSGPADPAATDADGPPPPSGSPAARPIEVAAIEPCLDDARWDGYVASHPEASAYHDTTWLRAAGHALGHRTHRYVALDADGRVCGCLPLTRLSSRLFGDFAVSLPWVNYGGALGDDDGVRDALMRRATSDQLADGAAYVEFRDARPQEGWPARTDKVAMRLALETDPAQQFRAFSSKLRAQVRKPQREDHGFEVTGAQGVDAFYRIFAENMRDLGTPVYGRSVFERLLSALGDRMRIALLTMQGRTVSAGVLLAHRDTLEIPWASTLRSANRLGANSLFYWLVLQYAIENGYRHFDFGRSTRDAGTFRFKRQWGAEPVPLHWHHGLPDGAAAPGLNPDNPRYAAAIAVWKRLPVALTRLIGPPIVRNLP